MATETFRIIDDTVPSGVIVLGHVQYDEVTKEGKRMMNPYEQPQISPAEVKNLREMTAKAFDQKFPIPRK